MGGSVRDAHSRTHSAMVAREVVGALLACRVALCVVAGCSAAPPGLRRNGPRTADLDLV